MTAYASGALVPLSLTVHTGATPQNAHDMQLLEDAHSVLEMYIWLARHFPAQFFELESALEFKERSSLLIQHGLETISDLNVKYGQKRSLEEARRAEALRRARRRERRNAVLPPGSASDATHNKAGVAADDVDDAADASLVEFDTVPQSSHQVRPPRNAYRKSTFFERPAPTPRAHHRGHVDRGDRSDTADGSASGVRARRDAHL